MLRYTEICENWVSKSLSISHGHKYSLLTCHFYAWFCYISSVSKSQDQIQSDSTLNSKFSHFKLDLVWNHVNLVKPRMDTNADDWHATFLLDSAISRLYLKVKNKFKAIGFLHVPYCVVFFNNLDNIYYFSKMSLLKYNNGPMEYILS